MLPSALSRWTAVFIAWTILLVLLVGFFLVDQAVTAWLQGPGFQQMLDKETSKGLKLQATYGAMTRVGEFGLHTDVFSGVQGYKTIVSLQAYDVSGTFNPLGVLLRRWEVDNIRIKSGSVMIQKTEATPGAPKGTPWPPWWALFWPYRVHLADVRVDSANILWHLQDKESGIYGTKLEITPNGRDFEYDAHDGKFATPMSPVLDVTHVHLLIRKPRLYCSAFVLGDDTAHPEEQLRMEGDAGLQDDRSMHLKLDLASLKVAPWLPESVRTYFAGHISGHFDYASTGTGLESGHGQGNLVIAAGMIRSLPMLQKYASITGSPDPGDMPLKVCQADLKWDAGAVTLQNLEVESDGVFRMTGTITMAADHKLSGEVELGLTEPYLRWLPTARTAIFTHDEGQYHFTTIHISGTTTKPVEDLAPRITKEVEKSPLLALKVIIGAAGLWF